MWQESNNVLFEKKTGDITTYPLKKDNKPEGSIVIWEYPIPDPPFGLYIGGCDPYDHDESFTNSLGSTFIFKRVRAGEAWNDVIVAEYTGRPATAEEYYENVRKLLTFYNIIYLTTATETLILIIRIYCFNKYKNVKVIKK